MFRLGERDGECLLISSLKHTDWKVTMDWHRNEQTAEISGIFLHMVSNQQEVAWIADNKDNEAVVCVHTNGRSYLDRPSSPSQKITTLKKSEIPGEDHGGCPEIVGIVFRGRKVEALEAFFSSRKVFYCVAVILLGIVYLKRKQFLTLASNGLFMETFSKQGCEISEVFQKKSF